MTSPRARIALSNRRGPAWPMEARMGQSLARIAGATGDQGHNITGDAGRTLSGNTSIVTLEYAPGDWSAQ